MRYANEGSEYRSWRTGLFSLFHFHHYYLPIFLLFSLDPALLCLYSKWTLPWCNCIFFLSLFSMPLLLEIMNSSWQPDVPGLCPLCQIADCTGPLNNVDNFNIFWNCEDRFKCAGVYPNITGCRLLCDNLHHALGMPYKNKNAQINVKANMYRYTAVAETRQMLLL